jgi:hypothetical protein
VALVNRAPDVAGLFALTLLVSIPWMVVHIGRSKAWRYVAAIVTALVTALLALHELRRKRQGRQDDQLYAAWQRQRWETAKRYERWP